MAIELYGVTFTCDNCETKSDSSLAGKLEGGPSTAAWRMPEGWIDLKPLRMSDPYGRRIDHFCARCASMPARDLVDLLKNLHTEVANAEHD